MERQEIVVRIKYLEAALRLEHVCAENPNPLAPFRVMADGRAVKRELVRFGEARVAATCPYCGREVLWRIVRGAVKL